MFFSMACPVKPALARRYGAARLVRRRGRQDAIGKTDRSIAGHRHSTGQLTV
jgi:hypothetical protein